MVEANLRFVVSMAKQYRNRGLSFLDLINEGNIGLMKSARTFDPERNVRFVSYAVWWIRQTILAALLDKADLVRIPQSQVKKMRKASKRVRALEEKKGSPLSDAEAMSKGGLTRQSVDDLKRFTQGYLSLDTTYVGDGEKPLMEFLKSNVDVDTFEKSMMDQSLTDHLQEALNSLSPRDGQILTWRYGLDGHETRTLDEIGRELKISKERVRQLRNARSGRYGLRKKPKLAPRFRELRRLRCSWILTTRSTPSVWCPVLLDLHEQTIRQYERLGLVCPCRSIRRRHACIRRPM
jgi:RNA polymerase primary sigma factor